MQGQKFGGTVNVSKNFRRGEKFYIYGISVINTD